MVKIAKAIALLNSMVEGGEEHSEQSRGAVSDAFEEIECLRTDLDKAVKQGYQATVKVGELSTELEEVKRERNRLQRWVHDLQAGTTLASKIGKGE